MTYYSVDEEQTVHQITTWWCCGVVLPTSFISGRWGTEQVSGAAEAQKRTTYPIKAENATRTLGGRRHRRPGSYQLEGKIPSFDIKVNSVASKAGCWSFSLLSCCFCCLSHHQEVWVAESKEQKSTGSQKRRTGQNHHQRCFVRPMSGLVRTDDEDSLFVNWGPSECVW